MTCLTHANFYDCARTALAPVSEIDAYNISGRAFDFLIDVCAEKHAGRLGSVRATAVRINLCIMRHDREAAFDDGTRVLDALDAVIAEFGHEVFALEMARAGILHEGRA